MAAKQALTKPLSSASIELSIQNICKMWPVEPSRPGRSLKEHLEEREDLTNADDLKYLNYLLDNGAMKAVPVDKSFKPLYRPAYGLLSTEAQKTIPTWKMRDFLIPNVFFKARQIVDGVKNLLPTKSAK